MTNAYVANKERSQVKNLNLQLKKLEVQSKITPKHTEENNAKA